MSLSLYCSSLLLPRWDCDDPSLPDDLLLPPPDDDDDDEEEEEEEEAPKEPLPSFLPEPTSPDDDFAPPPPFGRRRFTSSPWCSRRARKWSGPSRSSSSSSGLEECYEGRTMTRVNVY